MFLFGKKKQEKVENVPVINKEELLSQAIEKEKELEGSSGEERINILNELGSLYFQLEELDKAIQYYEASLEENKQLGKAYTDLIKIYNKKRQQAIDVKDGEKAQEYMDKVQGLMTMSKDVLRGKI